jgi:hypothetical protein
LLVVAPPHAIEQDDLTFNTDDVFGTGDFVNENSVLDGFSSANPRTGKMHTAKIARLATI